MWNKIYHIWDEQNGMWSVEKTIQESISNALLLAPQEHGDLLLNACPGTDHIDKLSQNNFTILFGGADQSFYNNGTFKNIKVFLWPTYWATYTWVNLQTKDVTYNNIDALYLNMNGKARWHRCYLMDELCKHELLKHGKCTWHERYTSPNHPDNYKWEYWKPKMLLLNNYNDDRGQWHLPEQYKSTLFSLVAETTVKEIFITEKTWIPLLTGKPLLVLGGKGFHEKLKQMGFKLYDELFDYDFDNKENLTDRVEGIISNIKNLCNQDYNALRVKINDKATYNKQHAINIAKDYSLVPEVLKQAMNQITQQDPDVFKEQMLMNGSLVDIKRVLDIYKS